MRLPSIARLSLVAVALIVVLLAQRFFGPQPGAVSDEAPPVAATTEDAGSPTARSVAGEGVDSAEESADSPASPAPPPQVHPDRHFSPQMRKIVDGIEAGRPVEVEIGHTRRHYVFHPMRVTTEDFRISSGPDKQIPASFRVYGGRRIVEGGRLTEHATLAVVNDAVSMALDTKEGSVLIERDAEGNQVARLLYSTDPDNPIGHVACTVCLECPEPIRAAGVKRLNDLLPLEMAASISIAEATEPPPVGAVWVDHNFFRNGPAYDASLKDIVILMVSGSTQTGPPSEYSNRAASYFTYAAKTADTYENQLGLRYLLMELVLIAEGSVEPDIEVDSSVAGINLGAVSDWAAAHRPQADYGWGHVAGWTHVSSALASVNGWSYIGGPPWSTYGNELYGVSVQERAFQWGIHSHELGHNIGAQHTSGGVMHPTVQGINSTQNFFTENNERSGSDPRPVGGATAAMDIYGYLTKPPPNVYGEAPLRHPEEMPFAEGDIIQTDLDTPVTFNPLLNDRSMVYLGRQNTELSLVEVGSVYPPHAGSADWSGNEITFTPESGFTGYVWFRYTMKGNVGNGGAGWMHAADVQLRVGSDFDSPTLTPTVQLRDDSLSSDFSGPVRVNPLLNDVGEGRLWSGDVHAVTQVKDGVAESFSDAAFELLAATVVTGNGSVELETRPMVRDSLGGTGYSGYVIYTPGVNEAELVRIDYTVEDARGVQASASIWIQQVTPPPQITLLRPTEDSVSIPEGVGLVLETTVSEPDGVTPTLAWTMVSGPGSVTWDNVDQAATGVTFSLNGTYILRLAVDDGIHTIHRDITVDVGATSGPGDTSLGPEDGLLVHWKLNENAGSTAVDATGNGRDGTIAGASREANGKFLSALSFGNQSGHFVEDGDAGSYLNGLDALSVSVWVKADATGTDRGIFIGDTPGGDDTPLTLRYDVAGFSGGGSNLIKAGLTTTGGNLQLESASGVQTTDWQHLVLTWQSGQPLALYIDGTPTTPTDNSSAVNGTTIETPTFILGRGGKDRTGSWNGMLDDLRIYNRVLTLSEVLQLGREAASNLGPRVDAGTLPDTGTFGQTATDGTASDDGNPGQPVTAEWRHRSGPGVVSFGDSVALDTPVSADTAGSYILRLAVDDGQVRTFDEVHWRVIDGLDRDGDGISDADEHLAGTDPDNANSVFRMAMIPPQSEGNLLLEFPTVAGRHYRVIYRDSLTSGDWLVLTGYGNIPGDGSPLHVEVSLEDSPSGTRFFRAEVQAESW